MLNCLCEAVSVERLRVQGQATGEVVLTFHVMNECLLVRGK